MILVIGAVVARTGSFEELCQQGLDHVHRSRSEDGCVSHAVHIDCENSSRLVFVEQWRDRAALDCHLTEPGSLLFVTAVRRLAEAVEAINIYDATMSG